MICLLGSAWLAGAQLASTRLPAEGSAVLTLLAANLLVFRTFRDRYLLTWIVGWLAYVVYRLPLILSLGAAPPSDLISQSAFIVAAFFFSAAILIYADAPRLVLPSAVLTVVASVTNVMRWEWWPDSVPLLWMSAILFRLFIFAAALQLVRRAWGRSEIGPWLMAAILPFIHIESGIARGHPFPGIDLFIDLLLGTSMLLIAFDDSKARTRRLRVMNTLVGAIAQAQDSSAMLQVGLQQLKQLMRVQASWFRLLQGNQMVLTHHIGVSSHFLKSRQSLAVDATFTRAMGEGKPLLLRIRDLKPVTREHLRHEGFDHIVLVAVNGKKSVVGTLVLASTQHRAYATEELEFLGSAANQLGLALENLRMSEQIRRSQREWVSTFDSIEDLILVHGADHRIIKANRALLKRLAKTPAEVIHNTCEAVLPKGPSWWEGCPYCARDRQNFVEAADPCFGGFSLVSTSSYYVWPASYPEEGKQQVGTIHIVRDTSERRAAEEKYRLLFEQVQEGVFVADAEGRLIDCNNAIVIMLGYHSREELLGLSADALYASADQRRELLAALEARNYVRSFEVVLRGKRGNTVAAVETSFASRDKSGKIERCQGFLLDVTEKKRAEDEIRRRNRELHALNTIAVVATQTFDLDEILNLALRQVVSLFGAETGSVFLADGGSRTWRRRAAWGHRSEVAIRHPEVEVPAEFWDHLKKSRLETITHQQNLELPAFASEFIRAEELRSWIWMILWTKDAPVGVLGVSSRREDAFTDNDEKLMIAIGRQLSTSIDKIRLYEETTRAYDDLRRTQEQLLQSEKMSAVGQLISGVAHELNNPLTAILGYAQLLESESLNQRALDFVHKLLKQAQRTHRLVQNLLSFARQRKPQKIQVDVRRVLDDTLALREYDFKRNNIQVLREIASHVPAVTADPHQLEQVFLNIINNSVDAMLESERGGSLRVRVYSLENMVCTEFRDTGPGIFDPKRIFDPFYTTKVVGKGTGLGLSICYGIVKEHGGEIEAQNSPEGGAVLLVRLPAAEKSASPERPASSQARETILQGRLLLVDDEEAVLEFEREVLAGAGADVTTANRVEKVLSLLTSETFDALILNGSMPGGWNARQIYSWLGENRPGMQRHVLFTFANLIEPETQDFFKQNGLSCLAKPFEVADLISATRRVLQKAQAASTN
jgi:PAS domain S-box-containing protein